jgi:hypothetical protein
LLTPKKVSASDTPMNSVTMVRKLSKEQVTDAEPAPEPAGAEGAVVIREHVPPAGRPYAAGFPAGWGRAAASTSRPADQPEDPANHHGILFIMPVNRTCPPASAFA